MRVQTLTYMMAEYDTDCGGIDLDDLRKREQLVSTFNYSVILECEHHEFDSLQKWIKAHFDLNCIDYIYYGKTGYDYGYAEFFVTVKTMEEQLTYIIPHIYTQPSNHIPFKTDGYNVWIALDENDKDAIVYMADK